MYQVRLLDRNRNLLAVLDQVSTWSYSRRPSEATEITVALPRALADASHPRLYAFLGASQVGVYGDATTFPPAPQPGIAELLEIWEGSRRRVGGRITGRSVGQSQVNVQALTEEILLDQVMTPAQYGRVLDNLDLADLARILLRGWHPLRVKDSSQWALEANGGRAIEQYRVDITTQPGVVMLAKDPSGAYYSDGYITLRFRSSEAHEFTAWDRIRWLSDNGGAVRTTLQYRWGESEASMGAWSEEFEGALPDTLGIIPGTQDAAIVDIRFSLYTDDTTSEDPDGDPVGQSPWVYAAEMLARTAPVLDGSALPVSTGVTVRGLTADNTSAGEVLREACERAGWEFWVDGGKLYLAEKKGSDRTSEFVLRSGTNCAITRLEDSDEGLVNVLTAYGGGDGLDRMLVMLRDEESIQEYGERPGTEEFPAVDLEDLETKAQAWLDEHKRPLQSWSLRAVFPFDEEPEYEYGDTVRVVDPESGILETTRIEEETRSYGRAGLTVELRLGTPRRRLIDEVLEEIGEDSPPAQYELRAPQNLRAETATPGINVYVNAAEQSRAVGVEIHVSQEPNFEPTPGTLAAKGNGTRWPLPWLAPGRWYIAARAYDAQGNYSPVVYASAVAGYVGEEILDPELQDDIAFAAAQAAVVEANAAVWGMAAAIVDATLLAGTVTSATATTVSDSSHEWTADGVLPNHLVRILSGQGTGQVRAIVGVNGDELTVDPAWDVVPAAGDTFEVSSSARITSRETGSIVAKLNADASESEFSSVLQAYNVAQSMVAAFSDVTITTGAVTSATTTSITDSAQDFLAAGVRAGYQVEITSGTEAGKLRVVTDVTATTLTFDAPLAQAPQAGDGYRVASPSAMTASTITQRANEIAQVVTVLNSDLEDAAGQYTLFQQTLEQINLRVVADDVITAINVSPGDVQILAEKIEFITDQGAYDADGFPIEAMSQQIWLDSTGLNMQKAGIPNKLMNINADRLAWWDGDGEVVAGMGSLDDLITQIDPDPDSGLPRKGLLIAQGAFLATQGVIRDAISDFIISREKLSDKAVARDKISNAAVGFAQLFAEQLSVPDTQSYRQHARNDADLSQEVCWGVWATHLTTSISADDPTESIRITYRVGPGSRITAVDESHPYRSASYRTIVNGQIVHSGTTPQDGSDGTVRTVQAVVDVRGLASPLAIQVEYKSNVLPDDRWWIAYGVIADYTIVDKNQRYAIIPAEAAYSISATPSGCTTGCEVSCQVTCQYVCQRSCQSSCQDTCESTCQNTCEDSCQATCEVTAQGCFTDGTPISVYDAESEKVYEIPIETLKPGMLMPYYDPLTDQVKVTECVSNTPSITATLYEITAEGPEGGEPIVIRATPEQPFDVYRRNRVTGEWGWSNMRSASLKPGDRMLRPFDEANRMPAIISVVKLPPQPPTRVWDAKTVTRKYIVAGFADDHFLK